MTRTSPSPARATKPATTTFAISPAAAQQLLDRVIYEAVTSCVDFEALYRLETMLGIEIANFYDGDVDKAIDVAKEMIDRAWHDAASDMRRYFDLPCDSDDLDCELCEQEAAAHASKPRA